VIVKQNINDGWGFCQDLTDTVRSINPSAVQVAEYWEVDPWVVRNRGERGAGFDATWHDGLRESLRGAISQAAGGRESRTDLDAIARSLYTPPNFPAAWKVVQSVENHDEVHHSKGRPRIPALAHRTEPRSWYARSRSRVTTGLLLTAPGIPLLFMGQEFLEDKLWSDDPRDVGTLIWWEGLERGEKPMADHLRFCQELIGVRRRHPALRGEHINIFHVHNDNRIIAFQRWLEGVGQDVVVVASLNESTYDEYRLGFPQPGRWLEVFNSDIYDHWINPWGRGNGGSIEVNGPSMHDLPHSAGIVIPANSLLVFARG
jgi:1,4-alpha-glucan branching enzyme